MLARWIWPGRESARFEKRRHRCTMKGIRVALDYLDAGKPQGVLGKSRTAGAAWWGFWS